MFFKTHWLLVQHQQTLLQKESWLRFSSEQLKNLTTTFHTKTASFFGYKIFQPHKHGLSKITLKPPAPFSHSTSRSCLNTTWPGRLFFQLTAAGVRAWCFSFFSTASTTSTILQCYISPGRKKEVPSFWGGIFLWKKQVTLFFRLF